MVINSLFAIDEISRKYGSCEAPSRRENPRSRFDE